MSAATHRAKRTSPSCTAKLGPKVLARDLRLPAHLFKLLGDAKQPWEVRLRAAILLKSSDSPETNAKLIEAIKGDASLEVAKHAQIALEQRIQRRFRLFDIPAIDAWASEQNKGTAK